MGRTDVVRLFWPTVLFSVFRLLSSSSSVFADIYIICNAKLDLAEPDIKDVFLGEKQSIGSTALNVVDNKKAKDEFVSKVLGISRAKYDASWAKKSFRDGSSIPSVQAGDAEVLSYVKEHLGGIGYVLENPSSDVKVLKKF